MPRKKHSGSKELILAYFLANVGTVLESRAIQKASGGASEWARRVRELRNEEGYQILSHKDQQFPVDSRCSPERVRQAHPAYKVSKFLRHFRSPWCAASAYPPPIQAESPAMPGEHCLGLYDQEGRTPARPVAGEPNPKHAVRGVQTKPAMMRLLEDTELVA